MADPCGICGWAGGGGGALDPPLVYWLGWIDTVGKLALPIPPPPQSLRPRCAPAFNLKKIKLFQLLLQHTVKIRKSAHSHKEESLFIVNVHSKIDENLIGTLRYILSDIPLQLPEHTKLC